MRTLAILAALWIAATAATLKLSAVAPNQDNKDTTCTAPSLTAMEPTQQLKVFFAWAGYATDSAWVWAQPGQAIVMYRTVPAGTYRVRGWATNYGKRGCDTTITVIVLETRWPPGRIQIKP